MNVSAIALSPVVPAGAAQKTDTPEKIREAATQFESLMIGQLLKTARESSESDQTDEADSTYTDMAEQQFAKDLAARGGLGIAKMVMAQLGRS